MTAWTNGLTSWLWLSSRAGHGDGGQDYSLHGFDVLPWVKSDTFDGGERLAGMPPGQAGQAPDELHVDQEKGKACLERIRTQGGRAGMPGSLVCCQGLGGRVRVCGRF